MISFHGVSLTLGERQVLQDITCDLSETRIGIIGANGSGKSSFLRLINGLNTASTGKVLVDDVDPARDGRTVRSRVSFLFSNPDAQIVMPTVAEDVAFSLRRRKLPANQRDDLIHDALSLVGLSDYRDHPAHALSSGQKQLLALAAIMVTDPDVLLCDEPTTLLDRRNTRLVTEALNGLPQQIILATHDLDLIRSWPRVLLFEQGRIQADTTGEAAIAMYKAAVDT